VALGLLAPVAAHADPVVTLALRDGTSVTGVVARVDVGVEVRVRLPDGREQVLPWAELRVTPGTLGGLPQVSVVVPGAVPAGPAPGAAAAETDTTAATQERPADWLARRPGTTEIAFETAGAPLALSAPGRPPLCVTPCSLYLRPGDTTLRARRYGALETDITLGVGEVPARITLHDAQRTSPALGGVLIAMGAVVAAAGAGELALLVPALGACGAGSLCAEVGSAWLGGAAAFTFGLSALLIGFGVPQLRTPPQGVARVEPLHPHLVVAPTTYGAAAGLRWAF
jgi:hypothetical protein